MSKKLFSVFFVLALAGFWASCTGDQQVQDREVIQEESSLDQPDNVQTTTGRGLGRRQTPLGRGGGRGLGRGRGFGRGLSDFDAVSITDDERAAIRIETVQASFRPLRSELSAVGRIVAPPNRMAIVSYAFPARISEVHVRLGDWVEEGQRVVTLQSEEVGNAKSEFYKARADYELARVSHERVKRLFDRGVGAQKDLLATEAQLTAAGANLDAAEKKLHVLGFTEEEVKDIADTHQINPLISLYSPIRGKVIENKAITGAMIDQSTEVMSIMNPDVLRVDAEIYEKDIAKIREGQEVEVQVPAYPQDVFMGKIHYITDVFKEETRTVTVYTEVANKENKLKPGMFADIQIRLNHYEPVLALPRTAVLDEQDENIVFVQDGDQFIALFVETGIKEAGYVQILRGIEEGDVVVTQGSFQLKSKLYEDILTGGHVH